ncbi:hypothetical protein [Agrobacterium radiobacter]|uniref:hypothetical protein n=1 Tax=Agrobacterium radiobacter TaxID=362 RepID=UPI000DDC6CF8
MTDKCKEWQEQIDILEQSLADKQGGTWLRKADGSDDQSKDEIIAGIKHQIETYRAMILKAGC